AARDRWPARSWGRRSSAAWSPPARSESSSCLPSSTWSRNGQAQARRTFPQCCRRRQSQRRETDMALRVTFINMKVRVAKKLGVFTAAALALSVMSGCMVGPNYHKPAIQTPAAFRDLSDNKQVQGQAASYADLPWWQVFDDPQLQELIRTALKQNYDLQIATERINASRAEVAITRSNLFPQVQCNGNFSGGKEGNFQTKSNFLNLTADAAFQLDLFGKLRRATEASRAALLATQDARQPVILTLVSAVGGDYCVLLQLDLQLQITQDTVKTQENSVKLTQFRVDHGVATRLDVLQA